MFNVLVVDSVENELNHLIFLLEDYKAGHPEFDRILNIIETDNEKDAINFIKNGIDILFVSSDMDKLAFYGYKHNLNTLIISTSEKPARVKKWYIDNLRKPFCSDTFNLRLRSYLDILVFKRVGIQSYERTILYDLNIMSNLHLFWENHFTTKANQNEIIHAIYGIALFQIDRGIVSMITVQERADYNIFTLDTEINNDVKRFIDKIDKNIIYTLEKDRIEFKLDLLNEESLVSDSIGEYEDFAIEYMNYDKLEMLNDFLAQHDSLEDEDDLKNIETQLYTSGKCKNDDIEDYINKKKRLGKKKYTFLEQTDFKIFNNLVDKMENILLNNGGNNFSIDEVESIVNISSNMSQVLGIYPSANIIASFFEKISDNFLSNGKKIEDSQKNSLAIISEIVTIISEWRKKIQERENSQYDFIDNNLIIALNSAFDRLDIS